MSGDGTVVVTGGAGFIGSNVVAALNDRGVAEVVVCDRLGRGGDKWRNLLHREVAEILPPERLADFLEGTRREIRAVLHFGAISATTATDARQVAEDNFAFSCHLWDWCTEAGVPMLYASSAATYGDGRQGFDDDLAPDHLARLRPLNLYAWSKHLFDRRVARRVARGEQPPRWAGLKFFNVYGPNEYHKGEQRSVVEQGFQGLREHRRIRLFRATEPGMEDGGQRRDFVWVGDCAEVVLWWLDREDVEGLFNVGTGQARTFNALARALLSTSRRAGAVEGGEIEYFDMPRGLRDRYQSFTEARIDRLRQAGYDRPFTSLEEGVERYVADYLATEDPYR